MSSWKNPKPSRSDGWKIRGEYRPNAAKGSAVNEELHAAEIQARCENRERGFRLYCALIAGKKILK